MFFVYLLVKDEVLGPEFLFELQEYGHIYAYRFRPRYQMKAYPLEYYKVKNKKKKNAQNNVYVINLQGKCRQAACIQLMIHNNLDPAVAQFPEELVTYGGNGSVFR